MRKLIILLVVIAAVAGLCWFGVQTFMAQQLRNLAAAGTGFTMTSVEQLRDPTRIGVHVAAPRLDGPAGSLALPQADLSIGPLAPTSVRLELPDQATLDLGQGPQEIRMTSPEARIRFLLMSGLAPGKMSLRTGPIELQGKPLASGLEVRAEMGGLGDGWPAGSRAAYDASWSLTDLIPAALPPMPGLAGAIQLQEPVGFSGMGRVWLDTIPSLKALQTPPTPLPTGIRIDNAELRIKGITARLVGMIEADENGRAKGAIALYTPDAEATLQAAADAGLIPRAAVLLGRTVVKTISALPTTEGQFPAPQKGELRLPLTFADGRVSMGPVPLGPAPLLRP